MSRALPSAGFLLAAFAFGTLLPRAASATPGLDACTGVLHREAGTATALTITEPGVWCLDQDMVESVDIVDAPYTMITVAADDVTIDCRGHRIEYTGLGYAVYGISSLGLRQRMTVRNCRLRGFSNSIRASGDDFLIEDNVIRDSIPNVGGPDVAIRGFGQGTIRRNRVRDSLSLAILARGGSQVVDNLVDGVAESSAFSAAYGIEVDASVAALVRGNIVRGLSSTSPNQMIAVIISSDAGDARTLVVDNVLIHGGSEGPIGIFCASGARVSDNTIAGYFAPTAGSCADTGDNDISP